MIVYILTNESMPDFIKIGITTNLSERIKVLSGTSSPLPFECFYAVEIEDDKAAGKIEKLMFEAFDDKRIRNREFFTCTPEQAKSALRIVEQMGGKDVTPQGRLIVDDLKDKEKEELAVVKGRNNKYFVTLGIKVGETLTFEKDSSITCKVGENREKNEVLFKGEITSLSSSARLILSEMGYEWVSANGAQYWCYQGKTLWNLCQ